MKIVNNAVKLTLAIIMAGILITLSIHSTKADLRPQCGAVVFGAEEVYTDGYPTGFMVYIVSQGAHAPKVKPGADLAPTIENLLSNGFEIQQLPGFTFMAVRR